MATTPVIFSFDDAPTKKPTVEENGRRVPGVTSLITPTSEGSNGSRSLLRARLKKLGEATKSKLVPNSLKLSPNPMPRYLEVEISPLLLCGVFSLSDVALSRKEMERGYVKTPPTGTMGSEICWSLPILHLQSSNGKRKKIIGWNRNQSEPVRVFIDTESKTKVFLEYGIVGQQPDDLTPLGTVEVPSRYKNLCPSQIHLNLKKRPLWPANNAGGTRILDTKFRLSTNARLSLQLTLKEAKESDLISVVASNTETSLSMIDENEPEDIVEIIQPGVVEPKTGAETITVVPSKLLWAEAKPLAEPQTVTETKRVAEPKTAARKTTPLSNLFGCLCGNNDKGIVEQDELKARQEPDEPKPREFALPTKEVIRDIEENSLLESAPDVETNHLSQLSIEDNSLEEADSEVETTPVAAPKVEKKPSIVAAPEVITKAVSRLNIKSDFDAEYTRSVPQPPYISEFARFVQPPPEGKDYKRFGILPMSFSSTTGSISGVSYSDTEHILLPGFFCYPLMADDHDDDDEEQGADVVLGDEDDSSLEEADYSSDQDGGQQTNLPEPIPVESVITAPIDATTTSIERQSTPRTALSSPLKQFLMAFKFRCTPPRIDESLESELRKHIARAFLNATWTDGDNSDLNEMTSDETSTSMSTTPLDGCLP
jgi:hypothetical protein